MSSLRNRASPRHGRVAPARLSRSRKWRLAVAVAAACSAAPALGGPDDCLREGDLLTCSGNQSDGVSVLVTPASPDTTRLEVVDLTAPIVTATTPGVLFRNLTGSRLTLTSGRATVPVTISTSGAGAAGVGMVADSTGRTSGIAAIPALGLLVPDGPAGAGGPVTVTSFSDITTTGDGAHGLFAQNAIGGYSPPVVQSLLAFDAAAHTYTVHTVAGSDANVGEEVAGSHGGTFTLYANGTLDFEPDDGFELQPGGEWSTSMDYSVRANGQALADATVTVRYFWNEDGCSRTCSATWTTCSRTPA